MQKIRCEVTKVACIVAVEKYATKSVANWKELSSFILVIFSNFSATKVNQKEPKPPKIFVDAGVSF